MLDDKSKRMAAMVELAALAPRVLPPATPWYEPDLLPGRSGVYEVVTNTPGKTRFRYFDGLGNWYYGANTPREALALFQQIGGVVPAMKWRGLTERAE